MGDLELRQAVRTILRGFDEGVFVRNIDGDMRPDWAIKLMPFVVAIAKAQEIVGDAMPTHDLTAVEYNCQNCGELARRDHPHACETGR